MDTPPNPPRATSVAHELKSPLTGIQMALHLLSEQKIGPLNDKQAMMIRQAMKDCERLVNAIEIYVSDKKEE